MTVHTHESPWLLGSTWLRVTMVTTVHTHESPWLRQYMVTSHHSYDSTYSRVTMVTAVHGYESPWLRQYILTSHHSYDSTYSRVTMVTAVHGYESPWLRQYILTSHHSYDSTYSRVTIVTTVHAQSHYVYDIFAEFLVNSKVTGKTRRCTDGLLLIISFSQMFSINSMQIFFFEKDSNLGHLV